MLALNVSNRGKFMSVDCCFNCKKRSKLCHSNCKEYIEEVNAHRKMSAEALKAKKIRYDYCSVLFGKVKK